MKKKVIIIDGEELSIPQAKKRRVQLARGFATGMFDPERHKAAWEEYQKISRELSK